MPINGSELVDNPWTTIMSPYTDLFGVGAYLIILVFIIGAVYLKTRSALSTAAAMMLTSMLFAGVGIYNDFPQLTIISYVVTVLAAIGVIMSLIFQMKR